MRSVHVLFIGLAVVTGTLAATQAFEQLPIRPEASKQPPAVAEPASSPSAAPMTDREMLPLPRGVGMRPSAGFFPKIPPPPGTTFLPSDYYWLQKIPASDAIAAALEVAVHCMRHCTLSCLGCGIHIHEK
jgi:hypothetical protein